MNIMALVICAISYAILTKLEMEDKKETEMMLMEEEKRFAA